MTEIKEYGGRLELSRSALLQNLAGVRRLVEPADVMAVVKANAYGAGAVGVACALAENGVTRFAVATVDEAIALRNAGIEGQILILTYFDGNDVQAIQQHHLTPSVFSERSASVLSESPGKTGEGISVWVKVDTGLGRLGVPVDAADRFIDDILHNASLNLTGIYSTLTENRERDRQQLARLLALRERISNPDGVLWSLASSNGILTLPESCLDVVRPGVMLLGFLPSEPERMDADRVASANLVPVVTWKAHVADVKTVRAGEQVGYGEQPTLTRDTRVASLMVGWSNGYRGSAEQQSTVLIGGRRCPVLDSSANTTLVDVSAFDPIKIGEEAVLLGRQESASITVDELARASGGVYRMLAGIPASVQRIWT